MVSRTTIVGLIICCMAVLPAFAGTWRDDFEDGNEDGNLDGWQRADPPIGAEKWDVENGELSGQYVQAGANGWPMGRIPRCSAVQVKAENEQVKAENAASWKDYSVVCRVKFVKNLGGGSFFAIFFRSSLFGAGAQNNYLVSIWPGEKRVIFDAVVNGGENGRPPFAVVPLDIAEDTWYKLKVIAEGDHFEFHVDDELIGSFDDDSFPSGTVWLAVRNAHVHFDDVVITGPEIPGGGPGFAVTSQSKIATMWGSVKGGGQNPKPKS